MYNVCEWLPLKFVKGNHEISAAHTPKKYIFFNS